MPKRGKKGFKSDVPFDRLRILLNAVREHAESKCTGCLAALSDDFPEDLKDVRAIEVNLKIREMEAFLKDFPWITPNICLGGGFYLAPKDKTEVKPLFFTVDVTLKERCSQACRPFLRVEAVKLGKATEQKVAEYEKAKANFWDFLGVSNPNIKYCGGCKKLHSGTHEVCDLHRWDKRKKEAEDKRKKEAEKAQGEQATTTTKAKEKAVENQDKNAAKDKATAEDEKTAKNKNAAKGKEEKAHKRKPSPSQNWGCCKSRPSLHPTPSPLMVVDEHIQLQQEKMCLNIAAPFELFNMLLGREPFSILKQLMKWPLQYDPCPLGEGLFGEFSSRPDYDMAKFSMATLCQTVWACARTQCGKDEEECRVKFRATMAKIRYLSKEPNFFTRGHRNAQWIKLLSDHEIAQDLTTLYNPHKISIEIGPDSFLSMELADLYSEAELQEMKDMTQAVTKLQQMKERARTVAPRTYDIHYFPMDSLFKLDNDHLVPRWGSVFDILPTNCMITFVDAPGTLLYQGFGVWKTKDNQGNFLKPLPDTRTKQLMFFYCDPLENAILEVDFLGFALKVRRILNRQLLGIHVMGSLTDSLEESWEDWGLRLC